MRLLKSVTHSNINIAEASVFTRRAARAIVLKGNNILLLYTERYHDFSLPGGGVDDGEDIVTGLIRELQEETGADNIRNIKPLGLYEEYRPWQRSGFDVIHMESYCYLCDIDDELGDTQLENHELENGMKPVWINIYDAIAHNEDTIKHSDKKGLSIDRETFLLKLIAREFVQKL